MNSVGAGSVGFSPMIANSTSSVVFCGFALPTSAAATWFATSHQQTQAMALRFSRDNNMVQFPLVSPADSMDYHNKGSAENQSTGCWFGNRCDRRAAGC